MFCVFSIGSADLSARLFAALSQYFNTTFFDKETLSSSGMGKDVLLISSSGPIYSPLPTITVFSQNFKGDIPMLCENAVCIVSSDNKPLLIKLSKTGSCVITCGMCPKDTITCTSIIEKRAIIATQRSLGDIFGKCHTPLESPFEINNIGDVYGAMAECALLTLLGVNI